MTTMVKGAESQMISISAVLIYPASIVPFQTQCEPFRCQRPRGIQSRAPGAQRASAPHRHLAASRTNRTAGLGTRLGARRGRCRCAFKSGFSTNHSSLTAVFPLLNKESTLQKKKKMLKETWEEERAKEKHH